MAEALVCHSLWNHLQRQLHNISKFWTSNVTEKEKTEMVRLNNQLQGQALKETSEVSKTNPAARCTPRGRVVASAHLFTCPTEIVVRTALRVCGRTQVWSLCSQLMDAHVCMGRTVLIDSSQTVQEVTHDEVLGNCVCGTLTVSQRKL